VKDRCRQEDKRPIRARAEIGLRFPHHAAVLETRPGITWLEVHTENYMGGGQPLGYLEAIRAQYPISLHGVGLSLGSAEGLDALHLERILQFAERIEPALVSEHLSWSVVDGRYLADLLPLPMTEEALDIVCRHVDQTQAYLRRRILIENPSTYLRWRHSTIPEWEFLAAVASRTGCGILCDVNNIYVSAANHGWDPSAYLAGLPPAAIGEIHLAGHSVRELENGHVLRIDDHGSRVIPEVWALYAEAAARFGAVPTLIEWDTDIPALEVLLDEASRAERLLGRGKGSLMPRLLDLQRAVCRSLMGGEDGFCAAHVVADGIAGEARLNVYRNTFVGNLTTALRLVYPAIHRLVGGPFFESAARLFIEARPPHSAWLDEYGAGFSEFLAGFAPAASLPYLPGVARLEWAVNTAFHAVDTAPLDLSRLAAVDAADHGHIAFVPHPSVGLVAADHPVDAIWRVVLSQDDAAMAAVDLAAGPVWLMVERNASGVEVVRLPASEWRFMSELCASRPLQQAIDAAPEIDAASVLAEHLAAGRFIRFEVAQRLIQVVN